jgi:hypothetical protein
MSPSRPTPPLPEIVVIHIALGCAAGRPHPSRIAVFGSLGDGGWPSVSYTAYSTGSASLDASGCSSEPLTVTSRPVNASAPSGSGGGSKRIGHFVDFRLPSFFAPWAPGCPRRRRHSHSVRCRRSVLSIQRARQPVRLHGVKLSGRDRRRDCVRSSRGDVSRRAIRCQSRGRASRRGSGRVNGESFGARRWLRKHCPSLGVLGYRRTYAHTTYLDKRK